MSDKPGEVTAMERLERAVGDACQEIDALRARIAELERGLTLSEKLKGEALFQANLEAERAEAAEAKLAGVLERVRDEHDRTGLLERYALKKAVPEAFAEDGGEREQAEYEARVARLKAERRAEGEEPKP